MPYSRRSKFRHEERRSARGFVRVRTISTRSGHEIRIGVRPDGSTSVISVLHPKGSRAEGAAMARRVAEATQRGMAEHNRRPPHAEAHFSPSHHVGPCDAACRAGRRPHAHRRNSRRRG